MINRGFSRYGKEILRCETCNRCKYSEALVGMAKKYYDVRLAIDVSILWLCFQISIKLSVL